MLSSVAVLYHPRRPDAISQAEWLGAALRERGIQALVANGWDDSTVQAVCCRRDLIVTFGGDGTIIRIARMASEQNVPVLGINMGRVGFLAEMTPQTLHDSVDILARAEFWVEERTMLDVECRVDGTVRRYVSLNEVTVARGPAPRAVHVRTTLDGEPFMTYTADGVLVATATGSTAYSLAAGGPILYPESKDILLTPVAPHLHIGRSVVVPGESRVRLELIDDRNGLVSVDGTEEHALNPGDVVEVFRSDRCAHFARFGPRRYFYAAVADRLR